MKSSKNNVQEKSASSAETTPAQDDDFIKRVTAAVDELKDKYHRVNDAGRQQCVTDTGHGRIAYTRENGKIQNDAWRIACVYLNAWRDLEKLPDVDAVWRWLLEQLRFLDWDSQCLIPKECGGGVNWWKLREKLDERHKEGYEHCRPHSSDRESTKRLQDNDNARYTALRCVYAKFWRIVPESELNY